MRKRNLFSRLAIAAIAAGSITIAGQAQADNDFEALLAEVDFGSATAAVEEAVSPSASDAIDVVTAAPLQDAVEPLKDATELTATPAAEAMALPQEAAQPLPAPPVSEDAVGQPVEQPVAAPAPIAGSGACGGQCGGQCGSNCGNCGGKLCGLKGRQWVREGSCQPYTPPQLPTSTFYQYWRSNPCNVNVWNGWKNRCHSHIDLSLHGNKSCGGCSSGCSTGGCYNIQPAGTGDCGPAPAEWCSSGTCDGCDAK